MDPVAPDMVSRQRCKSSSLLLNDGDLHIGHTGRPFEWHTQLSCGWKLLLPHREQDTNAQDVLEILEGLAGTA